MHRLHRELLNLIQSDTVIFEFIESSSLDGLWYWDLEDKDHEWMSESFWRTLGYNPADKEHLSSEWQDIIHPDDFKIAYDNFLKHCEDPSHLYDQLVRYRHNNGSTVWIRCRGMAIRNSEGKPIRMIGAHTDITDVKSKELELERTLKLRDQFFSRMSHEIRTPLFGLIGTAETLFEQVTDPSIKTKLATMTACGQQLEALLNDILTLSRFNEGKLLVSLETVKFSEIKDYLQATFSLAANRKGLDLLFETNSPDLHLHTDKVRLTQVLSNLLTNAIKYTRVGSITISTIVVEDIVRICVEDTGVGIKNINQVLRAYEQEDISYDGLVHGTGLGLDIVSKLCGMLGHSFTMSSELGKGTKAFIEVAQRECPTTKGETNLSVKLKSIPSNDLLKLNVLAVDDNEINREIINDMLKPMVAMLEFAVNGKEAVDKVFRRETNYDVVLMDINMPVKNGYEATREIRSARLPRQPFIISLSADVYGDSLNKCNDVGFDMHLAKPFDKSCLINALSSLVSRNTINSSYRGTLPQ